MNMNEVPSDLLESELEYYEARWFLSQANADSVPRTNQKILVRYDDGQEVVTTYKRMYFSSLFWDIHREHLDFPILYKYSIDSVLKGKPLNTKSHNALFTVILKDVCRRYSYNLPIQKRPLLKSIQVMTNNIYNRMLEDTEADISSIDFLDSVEIAEHPEIKKLVAECPETPAGIKNCYKKIVKILTEDPSLTENAVSRAVKAKMVNDVQVMQCVAIRGFPSEVDGAIYSTPIMTNYLQGLRNPYEVATESRSAQKSLMYAEAPLQDAEYFARRLQILCMVVEGIEYEDCGSTKYKSWHVKPPTYDDAGNMVLPSDLEFMQGKFYLNEETGRLDVIDGIDESLFDKVIKLRSALYCNTKNKHKVCAVCFGELSHNVLDHQNLGHMSCATMTQQSSQSVLSNKHLEASSVAMAIMLNEMMRRYFSLNKQKNSYILHKEYKDKNTKIVIARDDARGLIDIIEAEDVSEVSINRVSKIESFDIIYDERGKRQTMSLYLNQGNRMAAMSLDLVKYVRKHGYKNNSKNNFVIDLAEWDYDKCLFILPETEYSFSDHSRQIARIIESNMENIAARESQHSPSATLEELFYLVNSKLNVNIANLEVIIYATMIAAKDHYDLARNHPHPVLGIGDQIIRERSLSSAYAYEKQFEVITNPKSFYLLDRPDGIFDVAFHPREVVDHYYPKEKDNKFDDNFNIN